MIQNIHAHRGCAQISNKILFYSIFILSHQISMASEEIVATTIIEVASEAFTQASEVVAPALEVVSCINAGVQIYSVGKDIKSYFFPNKEEESRMSHASEQLELIKARDKFKHCLMANKLNPEIDSLGCPIVCKEAAHMLVMCRGKNELIDTIKVFNERKGKIKIS